jgi:outer membrane protein insertion porin family
MVVATVNDTNYAGSAAAFLLDRQYKAYDEQRYGGKFSVARRFGSRWTASVPLRIENVDLSSIDSDAPADYFAVGDNESVVGIGLNLVRSSVDDFARPSKGTKTEIGFEQVGGANSFTTVHGEYSVYAKLAEDVLGRKTVLQLTARATDILQGDSSAPFYERLYLGGSNFRGFKFRGVSPMGFDRSGNQTNDPIGGSFSFFAGAEVRQPLYEDVLAGVLFMDTGTVDTDITLEKYRVSIGFGFRLYVERLSPVPLAFDFGVPIMKEPTDQKRLFTFSVDVPFR